MASGIVWKERPTFGAGSLPTTSSYERQQACRGGIFGRDRRPAQARRGDGETIGMIAAAAAASGARRRSRGEGRPNGIPRGKRGKRGKREPPGAVALGGSCQLAGRAGSLRIERLPGRCVRSSGAGKGETHLPSVAASLLQRLFRPDGFISSRVPECSAHATSPSCI
jgi:hypothetical protein